MGVGGDEEGMGGCGVGYKCVGVRAGMVQDGCDIEEMYVFITFQPINDEVLETSSPAEHTNYNFKSKVMNTYDIYIYYN